MVGDEFLLLGDSPLPYSVITRGRLVAYEITEENLKNINKDMIASIELNCANKLKFVERRMKKIIESVDNVQKWEVQHEQFL